MWAGGACTTRVAAHCSLMQRVSLRLARLFMQPGAVECRLVVSNEQPSLRFHANLAA